MKVLLAVLSSATLLLTSITAKAETQNVQEAIKWEYVLLVISGILMLSVWFTVHQYVMTRRLSRIACFMSCAGMVLTQFAALTSSVFVFGVGAMFAAFLAYTAVLEAFGERGDQKLFKNSSLQSVLVAVLTIIFV